MMIWCDWLTGMNEWMNEWIASWDHSHSQPHQGNASREVALMCRACPEKEAWKLVSFVSSDTYSSVPTWYTSKKLDVSSKYYSCTSALVVLAYLSVQLWHGRRDFWVQLNWIPFAAFFILTQDWRWPHSCKMLSKRTAAVHDGAA